MEMSKKLISPSEIKQAIIAEAIKINRKKELYSEVKRINDELKSLEEGTMMTGTLGFVSDMADKNHTHGFVNDFQNISHIARLEKEMTELEEKSEEAPLVNEDLMDKVKSLEEKNKSLEAELNKLKNN
jgi:predicted nuclease with TOPRIM domain